MAIWNNRDSVMFSFVGKPDNISNKNWVPDDCSATNFGTNFYIIY